MVTWHDHMDALTEYCTISVSNMYLPKVIKFKLFHTLEVWKLVHIPRLVMPFFSSVPLFKDVPISLSFFTSPSLSPHNHLFPVAKIEQLFLLASSPDWIAYFYCIHYLTREVPSPNVWFLQVQFVSSPRTNIVFGFQPSFVREIQEILFILLYFHSAKWNTLERAGRHFQFSHVPLSVSDASIDLWTVQLPLGGKKTVSVHVTALF